MTEQYQRSHPNNGGNLNQEDGIKKIYTLF
jgi:hypothetical protein